MKTKHFILFVSFVILISGCYTVLRHPEVPNQDEMGNVYHQNIDTRDNCYSCHSQRNDQIYDYERYMNYYTDYGNEHNYYPQSRWDSYYNVPWWFTPPKVTVGVGSTPKQETNVNKSTSNQDNNSVRTSGSSRGSDVKISAPAPTRGTTGNSNNTSSSNTNNNNNVNNSNTRSTNSNGNKTDSSNSNNNNNDKRNTGSTRGK